MTQLGYFNRPLSTIIFVILVILLFTVYCLLIMRLCHPGAKHSGAIGSPSLKSKGDSITLRLRSGFQNDKINWLIAITLILLLAYPLFSHDIFNYIFNAKMVWFYKQNPHKQVAAYFIHDVWLRFMHNVHTPAPYAYGWTIISLTPGILTLTQNLKLSLWGMKGFIALFWIGQLWILAKIIKRLFPKENYRWFLFALNPLVLIETLVVGHNDVVMMFLALVSFYFLLKTKKIISKEFFLSLLFLGLSVSIKYATIILVPLWLACHPGVPRIMRETIGPPSLKSRKDSIVARLRLLLQNDIGSWAAIFLFAIIFTRLDQLHSWYLIWAFSFAILSKSKWIISIFTALTFGALLRYAPYLYFGNWNPQVYMLRNLIWLTSLILIFPILKLTKYIK